MAAAALLAFSVQPAAPQASGASDASPADKAKAQKQAEERKAKSEEKYRSLFDTMGEGFALVEDRREQHTTPAGDTQSFVWILARRT